VGNPKAETRGRNPNCQKGRSVDRRNVQFGFLKFLVPAMPNPGVEFHTRKPHSFLFRSSAQSSQPGDFGEVQSGPVTEGKGTLSPVKALNHSPS